MPRRKKKKGQQTDQQPPTTDRTQARTTNNANRLALIALVGLAGVLPYLNTFNADFTLDDFSIVKENELITSPANLPDIFTTNYWGLSEKYPDKSLYRPLTITSYAVNYTFDGTRPAGYHVVNVLLHACVGMVLFALVLNLIEDKRVAFIAGLLFAVHPIHTEAVAGIVGRAEILALLGTLITCWAYERGTRPDARHRAWPWIALSAVAYLAGMLSKEVGVLAPAVILLWEAFLPHKRRLFAGQIKPIVAFISYVVVFAIWFALRQNAILSRNISAGFADVSSLERIWTALRVGLEYVGLLIAPITLSADYWQQAVPIARHPWAPGVIAAGVVLLATCVFIILGRKRWAGMCWGLTVFAALLFPVSNIPFAIGVMKAERILYSPSAGFIIAIAAMLPTFWDMRRTARRATWIVVLVIACLLAGRTWVRNSDWRDNPTLAKATLRTAPDSPVFNTILGQWYRERKRNAEARIHYTRAVQGNPRDASVMYNLGNIELDEHHFERAATHYRHALKLQPDYASALSNLGRAMMELNRPQETIEVYERLRTLRPNDPLPYVNLMSLHFKLKNPGAMLTVAEAAVTHFPNEPAILFNAAVAYNLNSQPEKAEQLREKARQLDPSITGGERKQRID